MSSARREQKFCLDKPRGVGSVEVQRDKSRHSMTYYLPPLNALRAFEAAARHLSFKNAADELHVTPGAVGQHVRSLESRLGVALFERVHNGLVLTAEGQRYLAPLRRAFATISVATESVSATPNISTLTIAADPAFAVHWLVPRTAAFQERNPRFRIRIVGLSGRESDRAHIRILPNVTNSPDLRSEELVRERLVPAATPAMIDRMGLAGPSALEACDLISSDDRSLWLEWSAQQTGIQVDRLRFTPASDRDLAVHMAELGRGILLASTVFEAESLAAGRLSPVPGLLEMEGSRWFALLPPGRMDCVEERTVLDWLAARRPA